MGYMVQYLEWQKLFGKTVSSRCCWRIVVISNGPDLRVSFQRTTTGQLPGFRELKSVSDNQLYAITGTPDFKEYKFALVHFQLFNHLFGSAMLIKF